MEIGSEKPPRTTRRSGGTFAADVAPDAVLRSRPEGSGRRMLSRVAGVSSASISVSVAFNQCDTIVVSVERSDINRTAIGVIRYSGPLAMNLGVS